MFEKPGYIPKREPEREFDIGSEGVKIATVFLWNTGEALAFLFDWRVWSRTARGQWEHANGNQRGTRVYEPILLDFIELEVQDVLENGV